MLPDELENIAKILGALAAIAGIAWGVLKVLIPSIMRVHRSWKQIESLALELRPNGGASLRDAVDRMEKTLTVVVDQTNLIAVKQWTLVSLQPSPVFEASPDGECTRANTAYLSLVERDFEQIRGFGWENILHPDDRDELVELWGEAVKKRRPFDATFRIIAAQTKTIYRVQCYANPYLGHMNTLLGFLGRYAVVEKLGVYSGKAKQAE